jgi:hypothetical protein
LIDAWPATLASINVIDAVSAPGFDYSGAAQGGYPTLTGHIYEYEKPSRRTPWRKYRSVSIAWSVLTGG